MIEEKNNNELALAVETIEDGQKLVYEKPQMQTVKLFADQVFATCGLPDGTCQIIPPSPRS